MANRFTVTLPDEIGEQLQRWADLEGRPKANLAAYILESATKARFPEVFPPLQTPNTSPPPPRPNQ